MSPDVRFGEIDPHRVVVGGYGGGSGASHVGPMTPPARAPAIETLVAICRDEKIDPEVRIRAAEVLMRYA